MQLSNMLGKHSDCPTVSPLSPPPCPKSNLPNIARALSNNDPEKVAKHIGSGQPGVYAIYTFFIATFRFWVSLSMFLLCVCWGSNKIFMNCRQCGAA